MGYVSELVATQNQYLAQQQNNQNFIGLPPGAAYSSYFPTWEVTAPQYQQPTAYSLAQLGYRTNEVAYACIDLWMKTISEPPMKVFDKSTGKEIENHPMTEFMKEPCPDVSQVDFWQAIEMYLKIAGYLSWEKDYSMLGDLLALWPMMPQYCSFMRGQGRLLATIRYQPYTGLPYLDIDRSKCVVFSYVDPLYYGLKPFSPTMVLADVIGVDNEMTKMVQNFLKNGAFVSGLLKTEQLIDENDARFARERWQEAHGGASNAGQVAVLGKGIEFQASSNTFREMVFPEVDARSEARICMTYGVKPILISAKVGMDRSTFSNYEQARKAWYEENVVNEWRFLEIRVNRDILPAFETSRNVEARFDLSAIKALQEDRNAAWKRSDEAFKSRVITRDEARHEKGLDPMEDEALGKELFMTVMEQTSMAIEDNLDTPNAPTKEEDVNVKGPGTVKVNDKDNKDAKEEEKAFRRFAAKRIEEKKAYMISAFEFKFVSVDRQRQLLTEFGVPDIAANEILESLKSIANKSVQAASPNINITANIEPGKAPSVTVLPAELKSADVIVNVPAPAVSVNAPNVQITNELPKVEKTVQRVKRDKDGNIEGTVTQYDYEEDEE